MKRAGDFRRIELLTDKSVIAIRACSSLWCKVVVGEEVCLENLSELWVGTQPYEISASTVLYIDHFDSVL